MKLQDTKRYRFMAILITALLFHQQASVSAASFSVRSNISTSWRKVKQVVTNGISKCNDLIHRLIGKSDNTFAIAQQGDNKIYQDESYLDTTYYFDFPELVTSLVDLDFTHKQVIEGIKKMLLDMQNLSNSHENTDFKMVVRSVGAVLKVDVRLFHQSNEDDIEALCPFCEPRQLRGAVIAETENLIAFEKSTPARQPIDFLIVPKLHIVDYKDKKMSPEIFIEQLAMAQLLARQLVDPTDLVLEVNNGAGAGQIVFHSHMHFRSGSNYKK